MILNDRAEAISELQKSEWKTIGIRVRNVELPLLNRQLDRLNYVTLGDLVKDLIAGKLAHVTEDQQIEIMNTNLQTTGQITGLSGKSYDFYKQIDIDDLRKYLIEKYHEHTAEEIFKFKPHKRSWILQAIKRFGDYYFRKYNNREVTQLIRQIIERYDLNKDLDMKDHIYLVSPQFIEEKVKKIISLPGEIGFIARLGLLSGLREQELIYIKEKQVCNDGLDAIVRNYI